MGGKGIHPLPFKMHTKQASKGPTSSNALKRAWEGKVLSITIFYLQVFYFISLSPRVEVDPRRVMESDLLYCV